MCHSRLAAVTKIESFHAFEVVVRRIKDLRAIVHAQVVLETTGFNAFKA